MNADLSPNVSLRCTWCRMHMNLCVCGILPRFNLKTRVLVLMHHKEFRIISNTGHLVPKVLCNAAIHFVGKKSQTESFKKEFFITEDSNSFILYPDADAQELNEDFVAKQKKPITLIVPDGNWRQTAKMGRRVKFLCDLPKLILPAGTPTEYRLRTSRRVHGLCTFEAIARSLGVLESKDVQLKLEYFFKVYVERILWTRGRMKLQDVAGFEELIQGTTVSSNVGSNFGSGKVSG